MEPELLSLPLPPQVLNLFIRQLLSHIYLLPTGKACVISLFLCVRGFPRPRTSSILPNIIIDLSRSDQCPLLFLVPSLREIIERGFVFTKREVLHFICH